MHDCHGEEGLSAARRAALGGVARMSSRKRDGWARTAQPCLVAGRLRTITSLRELLLREPTRPCSQLEGELPWRRKQPRPSLSAQPQPSRPSPSPHPPSCTRNGTFSALRLSASWRRRRLLGVGVGQALLGDRKLRLLLRNARLQGLLRSLDGCLGCLGFGRGAADFAAGAGAAVCASAAVAPANASDTAKPMFLSSFDVLLSLTRCLTGTTTDGKPAEERTGQPGQGVSTIG
jgi:hypothetical protein